MSSGAAVGSARGRARLRSSCPSVCLAAARSRHGRFKEILVMQPTQHRFGEHECTRRQSMPGFWPRDSPTLGRRVRHARAECSMRTPTVVVSEPLPQDRTQMHLGHWDHPVPTLSADRSDHALADRVRLGACERRLSPEQPPACAMPAKQRRGLLDQLGAAPLEQHRQHSQVDAGRSIHRLWPHASLDEHRQLTAQEQILGAHRLRRAEQAAPTSRTASPTRRGTIERG